MKVLVLDDQREAVTAISDALKSAKTPQGEAYEVVPLEDCKEAMKPEYADDHFDVLITDMVMGARRDEGIQVLKHYAARLPIVIVITGYPSFPNCVEAMKLGAWDYIEKEPQDGSDPYERLLESLARAYENRRENPRRGKDDEWVHEHLDELIRDYHGQVIAVLDGKVVGHDAKYTSLSERIQDEFRLVRPALICIPDLNLECI